MKLSPDQIEQLKNLISYKGHVHIDVQYEILDHVACKVEGLMEQNPNLQLDTSFRKVFASFGPEGFNELEESYRKMIVKRHWGYFWKELKSFVLSFRMLLFLGIFAIFYNFRFVFDTATGWIGGLLMLFIVCASVLMTIHWKNFKKYRKYASFNVSGNFFLIISFVFQTCNFCYIMLNGSEKNDGELMWDMGLIFVTLIITMLYLCLFLLPRVFDKSIADTELLIKVYGEG